MTLPVPGGGSEAGSGAGARAVEPPDPFGPARLGPLRLRNRIVKAATFEGMSRDGLVSDALIEYVTRFAAGGAGATTLAYCAVSPEGRTYRHQLWMRPEALAPDWRRRASKSARFRERSARPAS